MFTDKEHTECNMKTTLVRFWRMCNRDNDNEECLGLFLLKFVKNMKKKT